MYSNNSGSTEKNDNVCLAYAYVPKQQFGDTYSLDDALMHGTLFPDLYKPLGVYGCESCAPYKEDTHEE